MPFLLILGLAGFASAFSLRTTDPMLPVLASDLGVTVREAALLASAYTLPYALTQIVLGPVGDAIGKSRMIRLALTIQAVGLALSALAPDYFSLIAARVLAGGFAGGIIPVALALIGDKFPYTERQLAISRLLLAIILGQMAGAALPGLLVETVGWRAVFAMAAGLSALCAVAAIVALRHEVEPRSPLSVADARHRYATVLSNPASLIVFGTVAGEGLLIFGVFPFVAPLLQTHGAAGAVEAGVTIAAFAVGGVLFSAVVRWLMTRLNTRGMMRAGGVLVGLAYLSIAFPVPWPLVSAAFLVAGFGFYTLHSTMQTHATELAPTARGSTLALFSASFFIGQGIGPVLYGAIAAQAGFPTLFIGVGLLTMVLGFASVRLMRL